MLSDCCLPKAYSHNLAPETSGKEFMTISVKKLGLLAETVGAIGIMISMIYLAYQVSQNTANIQAANALAISSELSAIRSLHTNNREWHEFAYKAWTDYDSLNDAEKSRFTAYALNRFAVWENLVFMDNENLLPDGFVGPAEAGLCAHMTWGAYRPIWDGWAIEFSSAQLVERVNACFDSKSSGENNPT